MPQVSKDYQEMVLNDLKNYGGLTKAVKASWLERMLVRKVSVKKLHPNPDDEFSDPEIGPSYAIVTKYAQRFSAIMLGKAKVGDDEMERLVVEKMATGGYMILNGHHRWMGAARAGCGRVPIEIVNPIHDEEIISTIERSEHSMCVSIDLDEVLLTDGSVYPKDKHLLFPFNIIYKQSLRRNAGVMIRELQRMGFDVWVYTGSYHSSRYFNTLFGLHKAKVTGIINGMAHRKSKSGLQMAFRKKYKLSIHVDNSGILWVDTQTKAYDSVNIDPQRDWANQVYDTIKGLDALKQGGNGNA